MRAVAEDDIECVNEKVDDVAHEDRLVTYEQAKSIVDSNGIRLDNFSHHFIVTSSSGVTSVCKVLPSSKCSCPGTRTCIHIIAAKMCLGLSNEETTKKPNTAILRKNARKAVDKKIGGKYTRLKDLDGENGGPPKKKIKKERASPEKDLFKDYQSTRSQTRPISPSSVIF